MKKSTSGNYLAFSPLIFFFFFFFLPLTFNIVWAVCLCLVEEKEKARFRIRVRKTQKADFYVSSCKATIHILHSSYVKLSPAVTYYRRD